MTELRNNQKKNKPAKKIVYGISVIITILIITLVFFSIKYVNSSLQPFDKKDNSEIVVKIPMGSSRNEVSAKLQEKKVIKSATVFDYYLRIHKYTNLRAGYYKLKPSMTLDTIVSKLQKGDSNFPLTDKKVVVSEGTTVDEIGDNIQYNTKFSKDEFLKLMTNKAYIQSLYNKYPNLLGSSLSSTGVRYNLEGYLFPATYLITKKMTLKDLVNSMVEKSNQEFSPYFKTIKEKNLTVQQALTLSSLVEREGVTRNDRRKISGVFFNRIEAGMPLQSDISVMYAMNKHKLKLTNKDTSVDSPYNLYKNKGFGPGPFNNPSIDSLNAVLNPKDRSKNFLYFVANLKTGKVYYSKNYQEHLQTNSKLEQ